ncbi:hypothetical protein DAPK24_001080 [Pichia kluyveri]|uniref:Prefoldin subunit 1 n=1 Tax=Pichia kluyveri TaxID=36015 RepID=A0AAV5QWB6_PICKL|nr:hypothetical protein DAPK24_001080 [Pichia kluyveri]
MSDVKQMVMEMQVQLSKHREELQRTLNTIENVSRNNSLIEKSMKDIKNSNEKFVWESVGRAFVKIPITEYEIEMKSKIRDNIESMNNLNKKKHYLETSIKNTMDSLKKVIGTQ